MQDSIMTQEHDIDTQQQQCEYCQHFQKDEYTGYCRVHRAYVPKTFCCAQFESVLLSGKGA
jgi:hypothetical protein